MKDLPSAYDYRLFTVVKKYMHTKGSTTNTVAQPFNASNGTKL